MSGYPAVRLAAVPHRCHSNGCPIPSGQPYLRTFYPPDDAIPYVVVSHRCETCATAQFVNDYIDNWRARHTAKTGELSAKPLPAALQACDPATAV